MELSEIKNKLIEFEKIISQIKATLKIDEKKNMLQALEQKTMENGFWEDAKKSGETLKQIKDLKVELSSFEKVYSLYESLEVTYELLKEEQDEILMQEIEKDILVLEAKIEKLRISSLLSDEYDTLVVQNHKIGRKC